KRIVVVIGKCDWEPGIETRDSRNCPAGEQLALNAVGRSRERQIVAIADDKIVHYIERRKSSAQAWIEGIDGVKEAGRVIDRLRPGVSSKKTEVANFLFQAGLQGIIVGIGDRC